MYKILLVDDEILVREAIRDNVKWAELGFELVKDCENGKDAIAYLQAHPVDVVLTDICMPYVDGMELSKYLYEEYPQTAIIIFSGYDDFEYAKQAIKYQVSEYILKPVTGRELKEILLKVKEKLDKSQELSKAYKNHTKSEKVIVAKTLTNLIKGTQRVETCLEELRECDLAIKGSAYRVAILDIDVYSELYEIDEEAKKESALMAFVANNIAREIVEAHKAGLVFQDNDNRSYILFYTNRVKEEKKEVQGIAREIQEKVWETTGLTISVGLGEFVTSLEELDTSYESAIKSLTYRYIRGDGVIFDCEEADAQKSAEDLEDILSALIAEIRKDSQEGAFRVLDEFKCWIRTNDVDKNQAIAYLHQVHYRIYEGVVEINDNARLEDGDITAVLRARTLDKAIERLKEYTQYALTSVASVVQSSKERQAGLALDYIQAHYGDSDITLQKMCEYLNISTSHFSTIFKEETGKTFLEALNGVRMEKAKQLLRETSLKNYQIAEKVGFSDPHYFNIAFKKIVGMTPKHYAKEHRQ
ncbi:response regulator transcription factor [Ohessyouella blattaphilus]|uniref:Stage 0 sporulation protein A homolog n=1 Tax=Ohessyouella blattaphilus TaxID=2949333 RepID=A0ABT1EJR0_9FIRM|nr:response regulator [Ohessyouella blattaphilus]MCP1110933.1 response regulator [Ohessyouella blattaphilus]MCR8564327.1 response regulator [Ohessyouella blattaphilus]